MIQIYLCDNNPILLEKYGEQITSIAKHHQIDFFLQAFTSGEQMLFHLEEDANAADIIYLDIVMEGLNGIAVAKKLRSRGCHSEIIFLTSSKEFVFDSFDVNPLHYILKEATQEHKFEDIFLRAVDYSLAKEREVFHCASGGIKKQIPLNLISFFNVQDRTVTLHYNHCTFDFNTTLDKLEQELNPKIFIRCHRSYIINLRFIDIIQGNHVLLMTGDTIPIGLSYNKALKLAFSSCLAESF